MGEVGESRERPKKRLLTEAEKAQRRHDRSQMTEIGHALDQAAAVLAKRAQQIDLHVAKNEAAGFNASAAVKRLEAADLRRIAGFIIDHRLHRLLERHVAEVVEMMAAPEPAMWPGRWCSNLSQLKPRVIDPATVTPSHSWRDRRQGNYDPPGMIDE